MRKILVISILVVCMAAVNAGAADVKNPVAKQAGNRMLFEFDVIGDEAETEVSVTVKIKGESYTADKLHLEGDFGKVKTGKGKKIYWNVLQDFPRGLSDEVKWEIVAGSKGKPFKDPLTGMEFVFVKGGCFQMGDAFGDGESDEKPVHEVCVDDIYMGKYEVTQGQWKAIMGNNPSNFKGCDNCPVEQVSWSDIQEFINKLNQKNAGAGLKPAPAFRLPTEAEWEYAARSGGKDEKYAGGDDIDSVAWYDSNSESKTHPVGQKNPNGLGIYDMTGNVWEWVQDWYDENYYKSSPKDNPKGALIGHYRVIRGGSWNDNARDSRAAIRFRLNPAHRDDGDDGFRVARTN